MTFNNLLDTLGLENIHARAQKAKDGSLTGYQDAWDAATRVRVVLSPDAYKAASDAKANNFVLLTTQEVSADKQVEDKETGKVTTVPGSAYTNHFVFLGEPTTTLGRH